MSKADHKRAAIVEALADFVLDQGLPGASLRPLAAAAGISDRMLLYYFADKDAIIAAVLGRIAARLARELQALGAAAPDDAAALEAALIAEVTSARLWRYMCVWLEIAACAARGDPLFQSVGGAIATAFRGWIAAHLREGDSAARARVAADILRRIEGTVLLHALGSPV